MIHEMDPAKGRNDWDDLKDQKNRKGPKERNDLKDRKGPRDRTVRNGRNAMDIKK